VANITLPDYPAFFHPSFLARVLTYSSDIYGHLHSLGHNLIGSDANILGIVDGVNADIVVPYHNPHCDPKLGSLAGSMGLPATIALDPGSLAIGAGDCSGSTAISPPIPPVKIDQRGFGRKAKCDIGAYETALGIGKTAMPTNTPMPTN